MWAELERVRELSDVGVSRTTRNRSGKPGGQRPGTSTLAGSSNVTEVVTKREELNREAMMDRDEQIAVVREAADVLVESSPEAASVLYGLCGAMQVGEEGRYALHCRTLVQQLHREAQVGLAQRQAQLN